MILRQTNNQNIFYGENGKEYTLDELEKEFNLIWSTHTVKQVCIDDTVLPLYDREYIVKENSLTIEVERK